MGFSGERLPKMELTHKAADRNKKASVVDSMGRQKNVTKSSKKTRQSRSNG
jgi:hypothetical protein